MCQHGDAVQMEVTIPARLSSTGADKQKIVDVDRCIAPIVAALNAGGVPTIACCGHGKGPGDIALCDGRELIIAPDYETARRWEKSLMKGTT